METSVRNVLGERQAARLFLPPPAVKRSSMAPEEHGPRYC